jgi:hypothetical protein
VEKITDFFYFENQAQGVRRFISQIHKLSYFIQSVHRRRAEGEINVTNAPVTERSREELLFFFPSVSIKGHRMPKTRHTFPNVPHIMNECFHCKPDYFQVQVQVLICLATGP